MVMLPHALYFLTLIYLNLYLVSCQAQEGPIVTTENGQVRGRAHRTIGDNKTYFAFQGIPFAQPPLGDLRFKAPVRPTNWTGILNATEDKNECTQNTMPVTGSEDCLYINVYYPNITDQKLPVMVWIYGGAFTSGNSSYSLYTPDHLLDNEVVFVSFNYRLGVFGFISTEDLSCPGNWGLKDQLFALQWVQRNVGYFGGDPRKVTIFGESAGAASVSYLLQSRKTTGLFRSAIMESGVSLCIWALTRQPRSIAFQIGRSLEIFTRNSSTLIERLRSIDYQTLQSMSTAVSATILFRNALAGLVFSPVIEPVHDDALFANRSHVLLSAGDFQRVPTIIGLNSNEAAAVGPLTLTFRSFIFTRYDLNASVMAPVSLNANAIEAKVAGNLIKFSYFGVLPASLQSARVIQFISDDQFNRPVREAVLQQSKYTPVYFYIFSYEGDFIGANRTYKGVSHVEELAYIFAGSPSSSSLPTSGNILTRRRMVKLWTNFVKYSNPTPEQDDLFEGHIWPTVQSNPNNLVFLNISKNIAIQKNPFNEKMLLFDNIYRDYGKPPFDTY